MLFWESMVDELIKLAKKSNIQDEASGEKPCPPRGFKAKPGDPKLATNTVDQPADDAPTRRSGNFHAAP
jgi:hypothetical protein